MHSFAFHVIPYLIVLLKWGGGTERYGSDEPVSFSFFFTGLFGKESHAKFYVAGVVNVAWQEISLINYCIFALPDALSECMFGPLFDSWSATVGVLLIRCRLYAAPYRDFGRSSYSRFRQGSHFHMLWSRNGLSLLGISALARKEDHFPWPKARELPFERVYPALFESLYCRGATRGSVCSGATGTTCTVRCKIMLQVGCHDTTLWDTLGCDETIWNNCGVAHWDLLGIFRREPLV